MEIYTRPATAKGPAETFTGDVWVDGLYAGPAPGNTTIPPRVRSTGTAHLDPLTSTTDLPGGSTHEHHC